MSGATRALTCAALGLALMACSSKDTLLTEGPALQYRNVPDSELPMSPASLFYKSYETAWKTQLQISTTGVGNDAPGAQAIFRQMAVDGFSVVQANCSEFFKKGGETQKWILFGRDAVGVLGTLATGILAITSAGTLPVSIVALSTTTLYAGIDTYTQNFLFGAENIDSVWTLVKKALDVNSNAVFSAPDWSFASARERISYQQDICKPARIRKLALDAITAGDVVSMKSSGDTDAAKTLADSLIKRQIGQIVGVGGNLSPDGPYLAGLCWAARETLTPDQRTAVNELLRTNTFPRGPASTAWNNATPLVAMACDSLSAKTQANIKTQIDAWKATPDAAAPAAGGLGAVPGGAAGGGLLSRQVAPSASSGGTTQFSIRIR